jgi:long-subunit acyl-CoA synthetase (AMP-forming)
MAAQSNLYGYSIGPEERVTLLSYLPLAHIYEVCWQFTVCAIYNLDTLAAASYSDGRRCSRGGHRLFHR